jgi:hypothetical protein
MTVITPYGFDFGHQRITRMVEHRGATIVRVLNMVTGQYVDVQTSPAGRKNYVSVGTLDKGELKREMEQPE